MVTDIINEVGEATIKKIQHLLEMGKGVSHNGIANEHEAANAMNYAMQLLAKHELSVSDVESVSTDKSDEEYFDVSSKKSRATWKVSLLQTIVDANFCYCYLRDGTSNMVVIGKPTNRRTIEIMYNYLVSVIESETTIAWNLYRKTGWDHGKTFINSFRLGMVSRIAVRLDEQKRTIIRENAAQRTEIIPVDPYKKAKEEAKQWIMSKGVRLHHTQGVKSGHSGAGYNAGRSRADKVALSGSNALCARN